MNDLEQALLARWDRDTLLVYADALQAHGDPRGELIALDIEIAERGVTPELARRRRRRLYEWLGGSVLCGRPVNLAAFRYGFATDLVATSTREVDLATYLTAVFASPAGPYVRGLTLAVRDRDELYDDAFAVLACAPRRWLERLEIRIGDDTEAAVQGPRGERAKLVQALIAATPRLHAVGLFGAEAIAMFPHPALRRLAVASSGLRIAHTIPHVETLDLLVDEDDREDSEAGVRPSLLSSISSTFELRHLDLARNEPHYPPASPPNVDIYPLLRWLPLARLRTLRLPSLREPSQIAALGEVIDEAPSLEVTVARTYRRHADVLAQVSHPRLHVPAPYPWPPPDTLSSREALTITVPTEEHGDDVSLTDVIGYLELRFDELPPNARAAWHTFWSWLADLPWDDDDGHPVTRAYPAASLLTALEPLDDDVSASGAGSTWVQLAAKLRAADLAPDAAVSIRRYWGW